MRLDVVIHVYKGFVLGDAEFESPQQAERIVALLMRLYKQTRAELEEGSVVTLPDVAHDEAIKLWCLGYLEATRLDDVWVNDELGVMMLDFPGKRKLELRLVRRPSVLRAWTPSVASSSVSRARRLTRRRRSATSSPSPM